MATTTPLNGWPVPTSTDYVADGAVAIEALGDAIDTSVGSGLLAWTSYTPTLTGLSVPNGTIIARYSKIGRVVNGYIRIVLGSGFTITDLNFSLPVAKAATTTYTQAVWTLTSFGAGDFPAISRTETSSTVGAFAMNSGGTFSGPSLFNATQPFTWKSTDIINVGFTYESAS
jgi:hypothetical protein